MAILRQSGQLISIMKMLQIEKIEYKIIGLLNVMFLGDRAEGAARP